jgi:hypothetical protein
MTTTLFLERRFSAPRKPDDVLADAIRSAECFGLHKVSWCWSFLSLDGGRMLCSFSAPDMESARIAMRQNEIDATVLWRGTLHYAPGASAGSERQANVLVERSFSDPVEMQRIQAIEDAGIHCLESRQVQAICSFFSIDRKRMICLYAAPDAESVREAQHEAGVPFDDAWAFRLLGPFDLEDSSG